MPEEGVEPMAHDEILRYEEILRIARIGVDLGVKAIRITGGEPLVRRDVSEFVRKLSSYKAAGLKDIAMTTNGALLEQMAAELKEAGLDRVNVSLDTLDAQKFHDITRRGSLDATLRGIGAAMGAGLFPVKANLVVTSGTNLDEVLDFAFFALQTGIEVRYIELMPLGAASLSEEREFVPAAQIRDVLTRAGELKPASDTTVGAGPAKYYEWWPSCGEKASGRAEHAVSLVKGLRQGSKSKFVDKRKARLGLITALSECFCPGCSRLRLTADGKLSPCLWSTEEYDIGRLLRQGAADEELKEFIVDVVRSKPRDYTGAKGSTDMRKMSRLGG